MIPVKMSGSRGFGYRSNSGGQFVGHWSAAVFLGRVVPAWTIHLLLLLWQVTGEVYIRDAPQHQRVRAGSPMRMHCTAGTDMLLFGIPVIDWEQDDEPINFAKDRRFKMDASDNSLRLTNTSTTDTGVYTCVATLEQERASASATLIVEDVPAPPIEVQLTQCRDRIAQLQWKLINENYSPVIQFIIQYKTSFDAQVWHTAKTQLPRDRTYQRITLSPWANYTFRVLAQNSIGASRPSLPTENSCHMPPDVPHHNPREICTKNVEPHTLTITWQLMAKEEQNAPGFYYVVKWRRQNVTSQHFEERVIDKGTNELRIEEQPIFEAYEIYVLAKNQVGEAVSPPRMVIGYSSEDVPKEIPQRFRLDNDKEVTDTTADFLWDDVNKGPWQMQGFFRGYKIQYWRTSQGQASMREHSIIYQEAESCWRNLDRHHRERPGLDRGPSGNLRRRRRREVARGHIYNLWPFTEVSAQIVVLNAKYQGPPSHPVIFRTKEGVPEQVAKFSMVRRGSYYLQLTWEKPKVVNGILTGYTIYYSAIQPSKKKRRKKVFGPEQQVEILASEQITMRLGDLQPDNMYRVSIQARTRVGPGPRYDLEATTLPDGPPVPPNFTAVNISKREMNVTWLPSGPGNPGHFFYLHYREIGTTEWKTMKAESGRRWMIVGGLSHGIFYEMKVEARNSEEPGSLSSSSPTEVVNIGLKREVERPTFKVLYLDTTSFGISLDKYKPAVKTFYANYRPLGSHYWMSTDSHLKHERLRITGLRPGQVYQLRVCTRGYLGELFSSIKDFVAGTDPDAQASVGTQSSTTSLLHTPPAVSLSLILVLYHLHQLLAQPYH